MSAAIFSFNSVDERTQAFPIWAFSLGDTIWDIFLAFVVKEEGFRQAEMVLDRSPRPETHRHCLFLAAVTLPVLTQMAQSFR